MSDERTPLDADRGFALGLSVLALAFVAACLATASRTWFSFDDFAFLNKLQRIEPWSWFDLRVAMDWHWWPFYRPLGMESFYYLCSRLFGLDSIGYVGVALLVAALGALVVYRVALQFGLARPVAAAVAFLAATRPAATQGYLMASWFHYEIALVLLALSLFFFLDHIHRGGAVRQAASCLALALGLLCNEVVLCAPAVFGLASLCSGRLDVRGWRGAVRVATRTLRRVSPQLGVVGVFWVFRSQLLELRELPSVYEFSAGPHVLPRAWQMLLTAFGGEAALGACVALMAGIWIAVSRSRPDRRAVAGWLLRRTVLCLGWIVFVSLPFAMLRFQSDRFALPLAMPTALLVGSYLEVLWRRSAERWPRVWRAALLAMLVVSLPYATLREQLDDPVGGQAKRLMQIMKRHVAGRGDVTHFYILHGGVDLASRRTKSHFKTLLFHDNFVLAVFPERNAALSWINVSLDLSQQALVPRCVVLALDPAGSIDVANREAVRFHLPGTDPDRCITGVGS